ncbi:MAG: aminoglycoside phosphotransferase family protein [Casimicrobiaceae bacterium]
MQRTDCAPPGADPRLDNLIEWLERQMPGRWVEIAPASADASFRRYFRLRASDGRTAVAMDAPPPKEDVRPFLRVNAILREAGLHAPAVEAKSVEAGFLLLEDLGRETYLEAFRRLDPLAIDRLMRDAIAALVKLQQVPTASLGAAFPRYDAALLQRELELFPEWYVARHRGYRLSDDERNTIARTEALLVAFATAQPQVLVHRDFMPRNLMRCEEGNPGILDHQDAVIGPVSYDIASLLRDAFHSWDEAQVIDWTVRYWEAARKAALPVPADFGAFWRDVEWMGLQRHLKVLGIFARIHYRDGKPHYLADAPRFLGYVRATAARYEAFAPLGRLIDRIEGRESQVGYTF